MSHSFPGPDDISRVELPNGIVVLSRANFANASVVINGFLPVGGLFDPGDQLGLSDFTASALLRGVAGRNFQQIFDALESAGASLRFSGGTHTTAFSGQALAEDLSLLLGLLADGLRRPVFPVEQVEQLRDQLLVGLAIRAQDTASMAQLAFDELIYADHPYSRPEDGYPETIEAIRLQDLATFHRKHYGPRGLVIAVVGAVDPTQAVDLVAGVLEDWQNPDQPTLPTLPAVTALSGLARRSIEIPGKSQADLVMGAAGPERRAADFIAANLGNSILGQFGLMGRIGQVVREGSGLAYTVQSNLSGGLGPGPWDISAGVDPQQVERVIDLIRSEIRRFVSEPVSDEELADNQAYFIGSLPLSLESNFGVAGALINMERYQLGLDYYQKYPTMIRSVTKEEILSAARRYLDPDRLGIAIAGPLGS
jgi:zinc protease